MQPVEPEALDRPWRLWASVIIVGGLAFSVVFGFIVLPVVQGYSAGVDPFTAICRAIGIAPGSPAMRQPTSAAEAQPTTQVAWSTDLLRNLSQPGPAGAEVAQSSLVMASAASHPIPRIRTSLASRRWPSISNCTITRAAAASTSS